MKSFVFPVYQGKYSMYFHCENHLPIAFFVGEITETVIKQPPNQLCLSTKISLWSHILLSPLIAARYVIGCLPLLPCRHCVKPANSAPRGKASLVIGSRKNVSEAERNVLLFSRPLCRANSNRRQKGRAYPVYQYSQTRNHWNASSMPSSKHPVFVLRHYGFCAILVYVKNLQNASLVTNAVQSSRNLAQMIFRPCQIY